MKMCAICQSSRDSLDHAQSEPRASAVLPQNDSSRIWSYGSRSSMSPPVDKRDVSFSHVVKQTLAEITDKISDLNEKRIFHHFVTDTMGSIALPSGVNTERFMGMIISKIQPDTMILTTALCLGASHLINQSSPSMSESELQSLISVKDRFWQQKNDQQSSQPQLSRIAVNLSPEEVARRELLILNNLLLYFFAISEDFSNEQSLVYLDNGRKLLSVVLQGTIAPSQADEEENDPDAPEEIRPTSIDPCLVHLFVYNDALASVTNVRAPVVAGNPPLATFYSRIGTIGVHDPVIELVLRIEEIQSQAAKTTSLPAETISSALDIWQDLNEGIMSAPQSDLVPEASARSEPHFVAASIWLYSIIHPDGIADEKVQDMVQRGMQALGSLSTSEMRSCSLFPFFVIGVSCIQSEDREVLVGLLDRIEGARHFRYIRTCKDSIRETWRCYDRGVKNSWGWHGEMKGKAMNVLVT